MADSDLFRIKIGDTGNDNGYVEIATADGGDEPIYARQYQVNSTNNFGSIIHEAALLDSRGNTSFPGIVTATNFNGLATNAAKDINGNVLQGIYDNAGAHNSVYRGKDLTSYFDSGSMSTAIANGTFTDIFPGDYIIKSITISGNTYSNVKWIVCDLDYFLNSGDTQCTNHHIVIAPYNTLGTAKMNATDTTIGGYIGSDMWKTTIPTYNAAIETAFGKNHILNHKELLTNSMISSASSNAYSGYTGSSSYWEWTSVECNLFNEPMLYGISICSSSLYDFGNRISQLAAIQHNKNLIFARSNSCWLSAITSATSFSTISSTGHVLYDSSSDYCGVRPYFLLY